MAYRLALRRRFVFDAAILLFAERAFRVAAARRCLVGKSGLETARPANR